jgi:hypothetical protein
VAETVVLEELLQVILPAVVVVPVVIQAMVETVVLPALERAVQVVAVAELVLVVETRLAVPHHQVVALVSPARELLERAGRQVNPAPEVAEALLDLRILQQVELLERADCTAVGAAVSQTTLKTLQDVTGEGVRLLLFLHQLQN